MYTKAPLGFMNALNSKRESNLLEIADVPPLSNRSGGGAGPCGAEKGPVYTGVINCVFFSYI